MNDIHQLLRKAAWRLGVANFLLAWVGALCAGLAGAIILRLVQQAVVFDVDWRLVAIGAAAGSVVAAIIAAIAMRPNRKRVALRVDEGANLREVLSTALYVERSDEPWARATVETAAASARRVELKRAVPITPPRPWPLVVALALAFTVLYIAVPRMDLFKREAKVREAETRKLEAVQLVAQTRDMKQKLEQMTQNLGLEKMDEGPESNNPAQAADPEAIRRSAIKQLTKLSDQLSEKLKSESALKLEATRQALQQIKPQGQPTEDLAKSMSAGNFAQAKQELEKLQKQVESGQLKGDQLNQAAEQLQKMAEEINKAAANKQDLQKKLEQAGLDKSLADNPQALKQAMEKSNLSEQQKQDLQKQAEASKQASEALSQMAESLSQMASQCQNAAGGRQGDKQSNKSQQGQQSSGQQGQKMDGAQQMSDQLSQMEQLQQEMEMAQTAMSECKSAMGEMGEGQGQGNKMGDSSQYSQGQWQAGSPENRQGGGRGGPGRGNGMGLGESQADFNLNRKKDNKNQNGNGPIVASRFVEGEAVLNDSAAEFEAAVSVAQGEVSEEINTNVIPRDRHEAVKNYFGRLKRKADDAARKKAPSGSGEAAPAAAPAAAEPAKDAK